jgi:hypothetical protein
MLRGLARVQRCFPTSGPLRERTPPAAGDVYARFRTPLPAEAFAASPVRPVAGEDATGRR